MCKYSEYDGYKCPYENLPNEEYCIFHLRDGKKNIEEFNNRILEILDTEEKIINFNGFYFPLNTADFSGKHFHNDLNFKNVVFLGQAVFKNAEFSGKVKFLNADFLNKADFSWAKFLDIAIFEGTYFEYADFSQVNFLGNACFGAAKFSISTFADAKFSRDAFFSFAKFSGQTSFIYAKISGKASFNCTEFSKVVHFSHVKFLNDVSFTSAKVTGNAFFENMEVSKCANFGSAKFLGITGFEKTKFLDCVCFKNAKFLNEVSFKESIISGNAGFEDTEFSGKAFFDKMKNFKSANFRRAKFSGIASFEKIEFLDCVCFKNAKFLNEVSFKEDIFSGIAGFGLTRFIGNVDFCGATFLRDAFFKQTKFYSTLKMLNVSFFNFLDFESAEFTANADIIMEKCKTINFKYTFFSDSVRIRAELGQCYFDGSNVEKIDLMDSTWGLNNMDQIDENSPVIYPYISKQLSGIHNFLFGSSIIIWEERQGEISSNWKKLEVIYRRLKQSYQNYGDYSIASEFYYKEMECKRKQLRFPTKLFWNVVYRGFCGYGEKPYNVILVSIFMIFVFSTFFFYNGIEVHGKNIINYELSVSSLNFSWTDDFLWCIYTSIITFTTLGYGDVHPVGWSRFFASIESGIGIFMTALFIFVFTRRMIR